MAENKNTFQTTVESLMKGMDGFVSSKQSSVSRSRSEKPSFFRWWMCLLVWVPVHSAEKKEKQRWWYRGQDAPSSVLVIQNGSTRSGQV